MKSATIFFRVLLGLIFFVFGLNGFFHFIPQEEKLPENAAAFMMALSNSGYFFPMLKAVEVTSGVLLLTNWFVPLALVLLAPITVNICLFHIFFEPDETLMSFLLVGANVFLAYAYRSSFKSVLQRKVEPG